MFWGIWKRDCLGLKIELEVICIEDIIEGGFYYLKKWKFYSRKRLFK